MTQDEFNNLLRAAKPVLTELLQEIIAEGLPGGSASSKYSVEELDEAVDLVFARLSA